MRATLDLSLVRIYSNSGKAVGAGCLVSQKNILTCAHVVADALGFPRNMSEMPDTLITLDFPLLADKQHLKAKVVFWQPVNPDVKGEDIAGLELQNSLPQKAQPAQLIIFDELWEHPFRVFGFPKGQPNGASANVVLRGRIANGWVQLEDVKQTGYRLEPGFSGAPIWDEELQGVAGIAVAAEMNRPETKAAFMIPASILDSAWNEVDAVSLESLEKLKAKLLDYFYRAEKFINESYSRSGQIDQECKKCLSIAKNALGLSLSNTATLENKLLLRCKDIHEKLEAILIQSEKLIIDLFIEDSCKEYREVFQNRIDNKLEELRVALGLEIEIAAEIFSLSLSNYGNNLLRSGNAKAAFVFSQALKCDPNNIEAHIGIGIALLKNNQFRKAIKAFKKAKEIINQKYFSTQYITYINLINGLIQQVKRMYWQRLL